MRQCGCECLDFMPEGEFLAKLFTEYFDGAVLVDFKNDLVLPVSERLTGKLEEYVDFESRYSENADRFIEKYISKKKRNAFKSFLSMETVMENLSEAKVYNVDFGMKRSPNEKLLYKRWCFRLFDKEKKLAVMLCEDMTSTGIDPLTGLYDSTRFHNLVKEWIENNPGKRYRIQRYDIDRFHDINGIYGYEMGNELLRECGYHMKSHDTEDTFSAHLNADHFVRFSSEDSLTPQEFYTGFTEAFKDYELKMPINIHMGVYDLCEQNCDSFTMSYKALLALQKAKGKFNTPIVYYEKGMMNIEIEQQEYLNDIDAAIENDELEVWFQPQFDYRAEKYIGAEALIRWNHPQKGLIQPGKFLPILENSGSVGKLDKYVVRKTCEYMRRWTKMFPNEPIVLSVNVSRNDIQKTDFVYNLKTLVKSYDIPPENLRIEITESAYMDDSEVLIRTVNELKKEGFIIEMDDFGSAYSSLNILKDINIDRLKLDMRFLSGGYDSENSKIIISSIISMAETLNLSVIAEGVETKEQADMLLGFGCDNMQGYYFSKPVSAAEYERLLAENSDLRK